MSNIKDLIRQEIDTRRQHMVEELMGHEENCEYHRIKGIHDAYVDLLTFLDYSLPEEKLSYVTDSPGDPGNPGEPGISDLEEAAEKYADGEMMSGLAERAFIAGGEWQREQMMKGAVEAEAEVCKLTERAWITPTDGKRFHQDVYDNFKAGDKVKIIIIKDND